MTDLNIVQPLNNTGVWRHSSHIIMKINLPAKKKKKHNFWDCPSSYIYKSHENTKFNTYIILYYIVYTFLCITYISMYQIWNIF
jgi:hypothetical protein